MFRFMFLIMNTSDLLQIAVYLAVLLVTAPFLGGYIARVFSERCAFTFLAPIESAIYRLSGIDPKQEMHWLRYLGALLLLNGWGLLAIFLLQVFQGHLPLNPMHLKNVDPVLALNTAISFVTNTNWQAYSGESTLSYLSQMLGLTVQNFLSAATGMAVMLALGRGIVRRTAGTIGNFWSDLVKTHLYVLLPASLVLGVVLIGQGVV